MDQLRDKIAAPRLQLTAEETKKLDEVSQLPPEYPGWMLAFQGQYRAIAVQGLNRSRYPFRNRQDRLPFDDYHADFYGALHGALHGGKHCGAATRLPAFRPDCLPGTLVVGERLGHCGV